jgi:hypothetical protein
MKSGVSEKFGTDLGLIHEVVVTGRNAGWGKEEWAKLAHNPALMREIASVLDGTASIVHKPQKKTSKVGWKQPSDTALIRYTQRKYLIHVNLGHTPTLPFAGAMPEKNDGSGWAKVELRKGVLYVDDVKVSLYLAPGQQNGGAMNGFELEKVLAHMPTLHPNILDALLAHPYFFPEDWKHDEQGRIRYIFFWSVVWKNAVGLRCVRYLYWYEGIWQQGYYWLDYQFDDQSPAAVRA